MITNKETKDAMIEENRKMIKKQVLKGIKKGCGETIAVTMGISCLHMFCGQFNWMVWKREYCSECRKKLNKHIISLI